MSVMKIGFNNQQNVIPNIGSNSQKSVTFGENQDKAEISKTKIAEGEQEPRSLTTKKWGVGIASFFLPGTGQLINGEKGKGIALLIGVTLVGLLARMTRGAGRLILNLAVLATAIYSCVNAVKNVKPDKE